MAVSGGGASTRPDDSQDSTAAPRVTDPGFHHLSYIILELPLSKLQVEGGDVVIHLSDTENLVLNSKVLATASSTFRYRMTRWGGFGTATHNLTKETIKVFNYRLAFDGEAWTITDENDKKASVAVDDGEELSSPFHLLFGYGQNFQETSRSGYPWRYNKPRPMRQAYGEAVVAYKLLFSLLYMQPVSFDNGEDHETIMLNVANTIAYAEFHDLLPAIAAQLESLIMSLPDLREDLIEEPQFYFSIAAKLHSMTLMSESIRHIIGKGIPYTLLVKTGVATKRDACAALQPSQNCHQNRQDHMLRNIRKILLPTYQAHADRVRKQRGEIVPCTWLEMAEDLNAQTRSVEEVAQHFAREILREWFDSRLYGYKHWSHVKYIRSGKLKDGEVKEAGSLRLTCELLVKAADDKCNLKHLDLAMAPTKYARYFDLKDPEDKQFSAQALLARELRSLVFLVARQVKDHYPETAGALHEFVSCDCEGYDLAEKAQFDSGAEYYTRMHIDEECMPWAGEEKWSKWIVPLRDVTEASDEWLGVVGAI